MKWTQQQQLEHESRVAFRAKLPHDWIVRDQTPDVGIDLEIEFVKDNEVQNKLLWVQIKATECIKSQNENIPFLMKTDHLKYYEKSVVPIVIVLWKKQENRFYALFAQKYINEQLDSIDKNWRTKKSKTIIFHGPSSRIVDFSTLWNLAIEGYFYIIERELNGPTPGTATYWLDGIPKSDNDELKERTLKAFGFLRTWKYAEAITEFENILKLCTISPVQKMSILMNLGSALYISGKIEAAQVNLEAVLELTKRVNAKEAMVGKAAALNNIGIIYTTKGNLEKALECFKKSLELSNNVNNPAGIATSLGHIGLTLKAQGDFVKARENIEAALTIDRTVGNRLEQVTDLLNLGLLEDAEGELDKALENYKLALSISQELNYLPGEGAALGNIGLICLERGDLSEGFSTYCKVLEIERRIGDVKSLAKVLDTMGLIYGKMGDFDKSLENHSQSLALCREIKFKQGEATALGNLGFTYMDKGNDILALKNLIESLNILDDLNSNEGRQSVLLAIAELTKKYR